MALSEGRHELLPIDPEAGPEFRTVAAAFNDMTNQLKAIEQTRLQLLGDLAHELRTPLANIRAQLEAVDDGVADWDKETRAFVLAETEHLSRLAGDLNEVSRAEEGRVTIERHNQSLADIVADVIDSQRPKYEVKGVALRLDRRTDAIVSVDAIRIGQALNNLLNNARRHTSAGGLVRLSIDSESKSTIRVRVTDNGEGIDADQLPHLFVVVRQGSVEVDEQFVSVDPEDGIPSDTLTALFMSTDGLRYKILTNLATQRPFIPFFEDVFEFAQDEASTNEAIQTFLSALDDQSGDDKTLLLAVPGLMTQVRTRRTRSRFSQCSGSRFDSSGSRSGSQSTRFGSC